MRRRRSERAMKVELRFGPCVNSIEIRHFTKQLQTKRRRSMMLRSRTCSEIRFTGPGPHRSHTEHGMGHMSPRLMGQLFLVVHQEFKNWKDEEQVGPSRTGVPHCVGDMPTGKRQTAK
eukprot:GHVT01087621.1.p1 GENE.GHVT01087621.1~~GHVT01087621.1.p1  ORF type:complete len:118 (-),score=11.36 GHVT01087621.1:241-594(-)